MRDDLAELDRVHRAQAHVEQRIEDAKALASGSRSFPSPRPPLALCGRPHRHLPTPRRLTPPRWVGLRKPRPTQLRLDFHLHHVPKLGANTHNAFPLLNCWRMVPVTLPVFAPPWLHVASFSSVILSNLNSVFPLALFALTF